MNLEKLRSADGPDLPERLRAKALLLKMNRLERAVGPKEGSSTVQAFRERSREQYRKWMGVNVDERGKLRTGLEDIVKGTRSSVADVIEAINAGTFTQTVNRQEEAIEPELSEWL